MCVGGLERIVGSLKSVYASKSSDCMPLNLVNASEVSNKQERSSGEMFFRESRVIPRCLKDRERCVLTWGDFGFIGLVGDGRNYGEVL